MLQNRLQPVLDPRALARDLSNKLLIDGAMVPAALVAHAQKFRRWYREQVLAHLKANPDFIRPERYRNEALNMLAEPLTDLCISRPKARLDWGIELPFDAGYVTYVWYDAFWAYVSEPATRQGLEAFAHDVWPHTEHFIGKDILKTHAVYWPPILLAAGLPLFRHLNVHGWLNFGVARMSKSSGNVADPVSYERAFGADVLRYFVLREMVYGLDGDFSEERLIERYNADLANDLGNLVSRVLSMAARYFNGQVRAAPQRVPAGVYGGVNWAAIDQLLSPVITRVTGRRAKPAPRPGGPDPGPPACAGPALEERLDFSAGSGGEGHRLCRLRREAGGVAENPAARFGGQALRGGERAAQRGSQRPERFRRGILRRPPAGKESTT